MFRGSSQVEPEQHAQIIARMGGDSNAFTMPDATVYHQTVPAERVGEVLRLEADRFRALQIRPEHLEIERKVILEELRVRENQPIACAVTRIHEEISAGHPYSIDPLGREEDLMRIDVDDMERFHRHTYTPARIVIVVTGAVQTSDVEKQSRDCFGDWRPSGNGSPKNPVPDYTPLSGSLRRRLPIEIPIAARIFGTGPLDQIDKPALDLMVAILSSGMSSPIREALVRKRRLCIEAGCINMTGARGGLLVMFGAFMPPGRHRPRHAVLKNLTSELAARGPDSEQFERHLKTYRKNRAQDVYSCHRQMMGLGAAELLEGGYAKYEAGLQELSHVTPERIQVIAQELFDPENLLEMDISPESTRWWTLPVGLISRFLPIGRPR